MRKHEKTTENIKVLKTACLPIQVFTRSGQFDYTRWAVNSNFKFFQMIVYDFKQSLFYFYF